MTTEQDHELRHELLAERVEEDMASRHGRFLPAVLRREDIRLLSEEESQRLLDDAIKEYGEPSR